MSRAGAVAPGRALRSPRLALGPRKSRALVGGGAASPKGRGQALLVLGARRSGAESTGRDGRGWDDWCDEGSDRGQKRWGPGSDPSWADPEDAPPGKWQQAWESVPGRRLTPAPSDEATAKRVVTLGLPAFACCSPWILGHPTVLAVPLVVYITPATRRALGPLANACVRVVRRRLNSSSDRREERQRPSGAARGAGAQGPVPLLPPPTSTPAPPQTSRPRSTPRAASPVDGGNGGNIHPRGRVNARRVREGQSRVGSKPSRRCSGGWTGGTAGGATELDDLLSAWQHEEEDRTLRKETKPRAPPSSGIQPPRAPPHEMQPSRKLVGKGAPGPREPPASGEWAWETSREGKENPGVTLNILFMILPFLRNWGGFL